MFDKVTSSMDFTAREQEILKFWEDNKIFEKSIGLREGAPVFTFYDGPPTANGKPHIGHVITRAYKDAIPRYKTMKGYKVLRKAGWDTHGLPVELEVEKELGLTCKQDIEKYGVESFIKRCKESVWRYKSEWEDMSRRVGFWADMENPYITYDNNYIESVWWAVKQIWDMGFIYRGHKIVPYCPRCGTSLSSHEVAQGYKDVKEDSAFVLFKVKDAENEYFMAWTTTPWTLPSNVALAVNPDEYYVRAKDDSGRIMILAEALVTKVLGEEAEVLSRFLGKEIDRKRYEPLFDFAGDADAFYVVCADYVTLTDGTGIVHTAPAFGEDDYRSGMAYGLPFVNLVDERGCFTENVKPWAGMFVKDADPLIIRSLKESGLLFKKMPYEHSYPFCWRCDTPLIYYARESWFIKVTAVRDRLIENNNSINWLPDNFRTGRMGDWLKNVIDWDMSRDRYWGTPVPIWLCDCGHQKAVGSVAELKESAAAVNRDMIDGLELHKPYIDGIALDCPLCGAVMKRTPEVMDCWFDAGSMPFAQWHYPFENADTFDENFPADFISEAQDQSRGWFYTLLAISTLLFKKSSFKNCIVLGHIQDKNGQKMSKSKGNMVQPWDFLNKQGADAVRWYFYTFGAPWLSNRFNEEMLNEGQRKMMGTLWNAYAFFVLYANIDGFNPAEYKLPAASELAPMDRWVLSKLNTLVKHVDKNIGEYRLTEAAREMAQFTDELSNWYIRRSRERFWAAGMETDKVNAYMTLYTVLVTLAELCAPFTPFIAEGLYQNLVRSVDKSAVESVHLRPFPVCCNDYVDVRLETDMDGVLTIVERGRAARNSASVKNRQPLPAMYVKAGFDLPVSYHDIILEELNVKELLFTDDMERFAAYSYKPQLRTLGKKYGKLLPQIGEALAAQSGGGFLARLREGGVTLNISDNEVHLTEEDVLVAEARGEDFAADTGKGVTVALDMRLTPELIEEGFVREVVSKLQNMRKEAGFNVVDKIRVGFKASGVLSGVISRNADFIMSEVLAVTVSEGADTDGFAKSWDINGEEAEFSVRVCNE
ncbi:MAG: isoleucine--tRNA ligase [Defluviitaleaceae bacterium]|nr:isoleucine--tRNA ligase [Defluviitaleaceae bacterium]MCL2835483.1 isoleucine--tRNA ligase [Defluviitaleaceae bacterium]